MVNLFIANTDREWFDFLGAQPNLKEANFWRPSSRQFHSIQPGEFFAFRLKSPTNRIGGFGILSTSTVLPLQVAWETFGLSNGAASYDALRDAIARYRPDEVVGPATNVGCRVLVEPVFLPAERWLELPESWSRYIQGGMRLSADEPEGVRLWNLLMDSAQVSLNSAPVGVAEPRYGKPMLIEPRLGQGAFRAAITEAYGRQCALSGGKVVPALDAAHIMPYRDGGPHKLSNGLLLRKDIHSVFDAGYATIDVNHNIIVGERIREIYHNGEEYRRLHGSRLRLPDRIADRPDPFFLKWHNDSRFLG
jgi:putative restriction endonuclease